MHSTLNKNLYAATNDYQSIALTRKLQALSLSNKDNQQQQQFYQQEHDQIHQGLQSYHNQAAVNLNGYNSTLVKKESKLNQFVSNQMPSQTLSEKNRGFNLKCNAVASQKLHSCINEEHQLAEGNGYESPSSDILDLTTQKIASLPKLEKGVRPQDLNSANAAGSLVYPTNDKPFMTTNFAAVNTPVSASPSNRPLEITPEDNKIQYRNVKSSALSLPKNTSLTKSLTWKSKEPCDPKPIQCTTCKTYFTSYLNLRGHYRTTGHKINTHNQQQRISNADYPKENQYEQSKRSSPEKFSSSSSIKLSDNAEEFTYNDTQRQKKYLDMPLLDTDSITQQNNIQPQIVPIQNVNVQNIQLADKPFKIEVEVPLFSNEESFRNENVFHTSPKKSENPLSASINSPTVSTIKVKNQSTGGMQNPNTTTIATSNKVTGLKCDECNKEFTGICYLKQHNNTYHSGVLPFKCEKCGKRFKNDEIYRTHLKRHEDSNKPHKCDICPKQFFHKTDLHRHKEGVHAAFKAYICNLCNKGFRRRNLLQKHYLRKHDQSI